MIHWIHLWEFIAQDLEQQQNIWYYIPTYFLTAIFLCEASSGKSVKLRGKMTLKNGLQSGFFLEHFRFPVRKKNVQTIIISQFHCCFKNHVLYYLSLPTIFSFLIKRTKKIFFREMFFGVVTCWAQTFFPPACFIHHYGKISFEMWNFMYCKKIHIYIIYREDVRN